MVIDKYDLKKELIEKDKEYQGSPAMLGRTILTFPQYNNSTRSTMHTTHQAQFKVQVHPDSPGFFTNAENLVGKYSDGYEKVDGDCEIIRKVVKYKNVVKNPTVYKLFIWDNSKQRYDVKERKPLENLPEVYGYEFNNDVIDSFNEGDTIPKDTVLYKSTSYDEWMNYGFGKDLKVMYSLDAYTTEDAAVISDEILDSFKSIESYEIEVGINDNDFPLNLYGDDENYKSFPDIGENIKNGILCSARRKYNNQVFYDFTSERLKHVSSEDKSFYAEGEVVDIAIYCNNPELARNTLNAQIYSYLDGQDEYYKEIIEVCEYIFSTGKPYSQEIDYLYKRSLEMIDKTEKKWVEKDSMFSNLKIFFTVKKPHKVSNGQKVTGRFGNKSVIAQVRKKENMPYYYDRVTGEKVYVQLILSVLAIINRTTGGPIFEMFTNFASRKIGEEMRLMDNYKDREKLLWEYIEMFNPDQKKQMKARYDKLKAADKREYIDYCMNVKIHMHQKPAWDTEDPIFYRLSRIADRYKFIQRDDIYVRKFGREIKCINKAIISNMYIMMLKQTSKKGFSVRGAEAINSKELPERSYKSMKFLEKFSSTAIRFGESESLNFMIGMMPEELVLFNAFYRTSVEARKDMAVAIVNDKPIITMKKEYTSRAAEIFNVILKSIGYEVSFYEDEDVLEYLDDNECKEYEIDGETFICTERMYRSIKATKDIMMDILDEYGVLEGDEVKAMIKEVLKEKNLLYCDTKLTDTVADMYISHPDKLDLSKLTRMDGGDITKNIEEAEKASN